MATPTKVIQDVIAPDPYMNSTALKVYVTWRGRQSFFMLAETDKPEVMPLIAQTKLANVLTEILEKTT